MVARLEIGRRPALDPARLEQRCQPTATGIPQLRRHVEKDPFERHPESSSVA